MQIDKNYKKPWKPIQAVFQRGGSEKIFEY
jgi:hypothetical protein